MTVPPAEIATTTENAMIAKVEKERLKTFLLAIAAGAFIGLGFIFFVTSQMGAGSVEWVGLTKVLGGVVFSTGLLLVILTGADLFTSTTMTVVPWSHKRISTSQWLIHWVNVYAGNFVGALLLVAVVFGAGVYLNGSGEWGVTVLDASLKKVSHTWVEAFLLGLLANFLVCLAVWGATAAKAVADKALAILGPIALFVATGFEHSVANMFLIPLGIAIRHGGSEEFWSTAGVQASEYADLTVGSFFLDNLIPVTLGNIVGGAVFVGLSFSLVYLGRKR